MKYENEMHCIMDVFDFAPKVAFLGHPLRRDGDGAQLAVGRVDARFLVAWRHDEP